MDKKKFIMITGPAGIGKTTVCKELFKRINGCAWLDGDWCWMVNPYPGKTPEQKKYVEKAFGYIINGYFHDDNTKVILFSWLMHSKFMFDLITEQIADKDYELIKIALVCSDRKIYIERMRNDRRRDVQIEEADSMKRFHQLNINMIDVVHLSVDDIAERIIELVHYAV
jgi:adenylate kinase family enzyme